MSREDFVNKLKEIIQKQNQEVIKVYNEATAEDSTTNAVCIDKNYADFVYKYVWDFISPPVEFLTKEIENAQYADENNYQYAENFYVTPDPNPNLDPKDVEPERPKMFDEDGNEVE